MATNTVDLKCARGVLEQIVDELDRLEGRPHNTEGDNKQRMTANAQTSRELLYTAHLADVLRMSIMTEYHKFKGENPPLIVP